MKKFVVTMPTTGMKETLATAKRYENGYICESPYKFSAFVTNLEDYYKNAYGEWVNA